jgi:hypothetical protein
VDDTFVYFTNFGSTADTADGSVMKVGRAGGAVTTLASDQDHPASLAVDPTSLYWISYGSGPPGPGLPPKLGAVLKLTPK